MSKLLYKLRHAILISILSMVVVASSTAIAAPMFCSGQCGLHVFNITTPKDQIVEVANSAKFGKWSSGSCQYTKTAEIGTLRLKTGDVLGISSDFIKYYAGDGVTCATFIFTYQQPVQDTFQLIWDAKANKYTQSIPASSQVNIK